MKTYGVTEDMLSKRVVTDEIKALIAFELKRTDALYAKADIGIFMLPAFAGRGIYVARVLYGAVHRKIVEKEYDTLHVRVRLSIVHKTWLIVKALFIYTVLKYYKSYRHQNHE